HLQMAQRYLQLAERSAVVADTRNTVKLATFALRETQLAANGTSADQTGIVATAQELAGFICERFLGDPVSAKACYRAALQLNGQLDGARRNWERLNRVGVQGN
ncbi:MAG: hypothetical protein ACREB3_00540, partial [Burkholderiales bacterium]